MKKLLILITFAAMLSIFSCGSGDMSDPKNPSPIDGKVNLSCAEATNMQDDQCSAERQVVRAALANGLAPSSVFNSGDVRKSQAVYYEMEAANGTVAQVRVYLLIDEGGVAGCEDRNLTTGTYPFDVDSGKLRNIGTSGTNYDICATNGASWANVTIYNGSHLALDMLGNPVLDEALYTTTILWNFTN